MVKVYLNDIELKKVFCIKSDLDNAFNTQIYIWNDERVKGCMDISKLDSVDGIRIFKIDGSDEELSRVVIWLKRERSTVKLEVS